MMQTTVPSAPAGAWARELADRYDALAEHHEGHGNTFAASLNRSEAAKYHQIAADMDAAFPAGAREAVAI